MRIYDIILAKRNGLALSKKEIDFFVKGYTEGNIPDYQASALMMAIYFQGMNKEETVYLTEAMIKSGDRLDLSAIDGIKVDKHSTGGVGDTTSLVLAPMVAAAGAPVAKMSGRGLGHTGGTIDKLDVFPGINLELSDQEFIDNVNDIKLAISGQTGNLAPADKKLYALRDVTATVENMSLIASSIMSKKLASGADAIVLDVKTGSGAFMKDIDDSFELARTMVDIGNNMGRETVAIVTDMDQPLGRAIGNSLEIEEAILSLKGEGPDDLYQLCLKLGAHMLVLAKTVENEEEGIERLIKIVEDGSALEKFKEFIARQGGDPKLVDKTELLPQAKYVVDVKSDRTAYVKHIEADMVGMAALHLGAGRERVDSAIDLAVGIKLFKKVGDRVEVGETIGQIYSNDKEKTPVAVEKLLESYSFSQSKVQPRQLIYGVVDKYN